MSNEQKAARSSEEIASVWTEARRKEARPRDVEITTGLAEDSETTQPATKRRDVAPDRASAVPSARQWEAIAAAAPVPDPTAWPWRTIGQLFFNAGGEPFTGTAYAIGTNTLLTAAHNLYYQGTWSEDLLFVPALAGDHAPFGAWAYVREIVMPDWQVTPSPAYDVGIVWLALGGNNRRPIGEIVGSLGLTYNRTLPRDWIDVGYPGDQRTMIADPGSFTRSFDGGRIVGKTGSIGSGASGGPWLLYGNTDFANGIHSASQSADEKISPTFRDSIARFIADHVA